MLYFKQVSCCSIAGAGRQTQTDGAGVNIMTILYSICVVSLMYTIVFVYDIYSTVSSINYCYRWETLQASYWTNIPHLCLLLGPYLVFVVLRKPVSHHQSNDFSCTSNKKEHPHWYGFLGGKPNRTEVNDNCHGKDIKLSVLEKGNDSTVISGKDVSSQN